MQLLDNFEWCVAFASELFGLATHDAADGRRTGVHEMQMRRQHAETKPFFSPVADLFFYDWPSAQVKTLSI